MDYPKNAEEWWEWVDRDWDKLVRIMERYLPMGGYEGLVDSEEGDLPELKSILPTTMREEIARLKDRRDVVLARYLSAAWGAAPDSPSIHDIPGWGVLCDLLAEEYVLYPEESAAEGD